MLKVILLGDAGVGKTSIRNKLKEGTFVSKYKATIGVDLACLEICDVSVQIWDSAGLERFQSMGTSYYQGADALFLVYDVTDTKSLQNLAYWLKKFLKHAQIDSADDFPIMLIGNKTDVVGESKVSLSSLQGMADVLKLICLEHDSHTRQAATQAANSWFTKPKLFQRSDSAGFRKLGSQRKPRPESIALHNKPSRVSIGTAFSFYTARSDGYSEQDEESQRLLSVETLYFEEESLSGIQVFETSAKSGLGITTAFEYLVNNVTPIYLMDDISSLDSDDFHPPDYRRTLWSCFSCCF